MGVSSEQLQAQNFREIPFWKTTGMFGLAEKTLSTSQDQRGEIHLVNSAGKEIWLEVFFTLFSNHGRPYLLLITEDITGRKQAESTLTLAYDSTFEGWLRALFLRDKETQEHTQRVVEMTERLARAMGVSEGELENIRRGALLHDIGKLAIPDSILLKPGPLSDEQWTIMKKHPIYAYQLLSPIDHLRPLLDIPFCHHEKWDGSGYPRGLRGEEIPLAARVFSVVDVWDALISDRPYRAAWTKQQARQYIQDQANRHFDPQVVRLFLEMVQES
jgi:putative nucleotidyltransferase with HDIG domain